MKVILELDDKYAGVLTLTAIGCSIGSVYVSTQSIDLSKYNHLTLGSDGKWMTRRAEDGK